MPQHLAFICKCAQIISSHEILFLNQATENRNPARERKLSPQIRQRDIFSIPNLFFFFFFYPHSRTLKRYFRKLRRAHILWPSDFFPKLSFNLVNLFFGPSSQMIKGSWSSTCSPLFAVGPRAIQCAKEVIRNILTL